MAAVVIGVDPAKRSTTIEVIDSEETVLLARFENTSADYRKMLALVKRWPERKWAVEGATGVGLGLPQRTRSARADVFLCMAMKTRQVVYVRIGPAGDGSMLEVGVLDIDGDDPVVIHAMPLRREFNRFLE